jgi:hypothetical protein
MHRPATQAARSPHSLAATHIRGGGVQATSNDDRTRDDRQNANND